MSRDQSSYNKANATAALAAIVHAVVRSVPGMERPNALIKGMSKLHRLGVSVDHDACRFTCERSECRVEVLRRFVRRAEGKSDDPQQPWKLQDLGEVASRCATP